MIVWDVNRYAFSLPCGDYAITWYGLFFAFGFLVGYWIIRALFASYLRDKEGALRLVDSLSLYVIVGAVIGARIGHVFFYDWAYFSRHLGQIFLVWEGGLASHGAAVGILTALALFTYTHRKIGFLVLLDAVAVVAAFVGMCIRLGNFFNQEILGTPTTLPWGILFLHPLQKAPPGPLHPVQLYEALACLLLFIALLIIFRFHKKLGTGLISGIFFLSLFTFRFFIEFLKLPQNEHFDTHSVLSMGQWLSLPFILVGLYLVLRYVKLRR